MKCGEKMTFDIGNRDKELMGKLHIENFNNLLTYYPYRYDVIKLSSLNDCINNKGTINVQIYSSPLISYIRKGLNRLSFKCLANGVLFNVTIFNRAFLRNKLIPGCYASITGTFDSNRNNFTATDISLEVYKSSKIVPIYHLANGITNKQVSALLKRNVDKSKDILDYVPKIFNEKYNLLDKEVALRYIHFPENALELKRGQLKLIYEEFFIFTFKINYLKNLRTKKNGIKRDIQYSLIEEFLKSLPFTLTEDQLQAINEIYNDMTSSNRMNRLVLGDVGSGKTVVGIAAMMINKYSGYQSAMLVPTEVLAYQHYETINSLAPTLKVALLVGGTTAKEKRMILEKLANGSIDCLIGTHAILNDKVQFNNLGLVITDEQHRFGVNQRQILSNKGTLVDIIYMSATPIPRTYALGLYGDMDLSFIKTKPKGRKEIITKFILEKDIKIALETTYSELKKGHQVYVVAPSIEESTNIEDVKSLEKKFTLAFGTKYQIGLLHGKMKKKEKNEIIEKFKRKDIQILVSTTVIEVGVDVKNATVMLIYNANYFGLATLHQLRGRVGRNNVNCYCFLISKDECVRLRILEESNDGFYISKKDFEMRGEGDLFGEKQSGDMVFKIGNIKKDTKILMQCVKDSAWYLDNFDSNQLYIDIIDGLQKQD